MDLNGVLGVLALLRGLRRHEMDLDIDIDWEAVDVLDNAAQVAVVAASMMEEEMEEERRGRRGRSRARHMEAARDASVMLGHNMHQSTHRGHRRNLSTMSDYFDAVGEEHIENDEHDYQYGSIFSTLASTHKPSSIAQAMQDWHTRLRSTSPTTTFKKSPATSTGAPSITIQEPLTDVGQAMKEWHARTRLKRRGTNRGMDIVASSFDLGEWEGLLGKMMDGWEESVLAFVLLVVMFRLWLLDAFGGRI